MNDRMRMVLILLMLFIMVAPVVSMDTGKDTKEREVNVGRAFAHCAKLSKNNYEIWITGIISTIVGITGIKALKDIKATFEYFEKNGIGKYDYK